MLIRNAEILDLGDPGHSASRITDVRTRGDLVSETGDLEPRPGEQVIDAAGSLLIPSLHDHHVHFFSYAASLNSIRCGPPEVTSEAELIHALSVIPPSDVWLRGVAYHESIAGDIDRAWLDHHGPSAPVRIQHRSGRLWIINSAGLELLKVADRSTPRISLPADGRFFDQDQQLTPLFGRSLPPVQRASQQLAAYGITAFNDMTPANDPQTLASFCELQLSGDLLQKVAVSGRLSLFADTDVTTGGKIENPGRREHGMTPDKTWSNRVLPSQVWPSHTKIHLHDSNLPAFDHLVNIIRDSHVVERGVAVHCVTETALVFALAAIKEAGVLSSDRIEHASMANDQHLEMMRELGVTVVTQPNFVRERGDAYLHDIPTAEHGALYRCESLVARKIPLAFASDMPFGNPNPWLNMQAAVERRTMDGNVLGELERVQPETALACFLGPLNDPAVPRRIETGQTADLCLLTLPWQRLRQDLSCGQVRLTLRDGETIYEQP